MGEKDQRPRFVPPVTKLNLDRYRKTVKSLLANADQLRKAAAQYPLFIDVGTYRFVISEGAEGVNTLATDIELTIAARDFA